MSEIQHDITIQITKKCNLYCSYCFSQDKDSNDDIDINDFYRVINFAHDNRIKFIRITGGEPFLHTNIYDILNYSLTNKKYVTVFTNFTIKVQFEKIINPENITAVVNLNNLKRESPLLYTVQMDNIKLHRENGGNIVLGYNIFSKEFDFDYIFEVSQKFNIKKIRIGLTNHKIKSKNIFLHSEDYRSVCASLVKKFKKNSGSEVTFFVDCPIRFCLLSPEDRDYLMINNGLKGICSPRIALDTALNISHCYATEAIEQNKNSFFSCKSLEDLLKATKNHYDRIQNQVGVLEKCNSCIYYTSRKCTGGCFSNRRACIHGI